MMGKAFPGFRPRTARGRSVGLFALLGFRPDLLLPSPMPGASVGVGRVAREKRGEILVGAAPVRIAAGNTHRVLLRIANVTHLLADGTESPDLVWDNGRWRSREFGTIIQAHLKVSFGKSATANNADLDIGKDIEYGSEPPMADVWIVAVGTPAYKVRYMLEEITDYDDEKK